MSDELTAEQQIKKLKQEIKDLQARNKTMAEINANAAEIVAELEAKKEEVSQLNKKYAQSNSELARANAQAAELMAEIEEQREKLAAKNEKLTALNDEKNQLLGMVSHDILSGIAVIGFQNEMLMKSLPNVDENFLKGLYRIHKYVRHINELVNDSLNVSQIEEGKMEPHFEEHSLVDLLRDVVDLHSLAAKDKNQELELQIDNNIPKIKIDQSMINQVLNNIISNAVKYTPKGGKITVSLSSESDGYFIRICDSGPGFTDEDLKKIFSAFSTLSAKPTGGEKSHGLGLAISKKLIELHNSELHARNNPDGGACFQFYLAKNPQEKS